MRAVMTTTLDSPPAVPVSVHTFKSADGGHDIVAKVYADGMMSVRQGEGLVVLSAQDLKNLTKCRDMLA